MCSGVSAPPTNLLWNLALKTPLSNSRRLWEEEGWRTILDSGFENTSLHPNASLFRHVMTGGNIVGILQERGAPESPDFLSVDIDYNDFWVLDTVLCAFAPRVIVADVKLKVGLARSDSLFFLPTGGQRPSSLPS